ncbi:4a-hydroxytetrahydrobiopterin dehydratase [Streptomyces flavofungini]|uniref:Putative pterin-4-alpha-carbinolamine dehydratase n=1 Tax=Streptomyces flavofungini TaxID=68200 RepID=A0ABS0X565_9ACTN|nr:4a-hydroxytetrahydrobiopterin dehydratase [Streptomyces flavofungini]MBJ3808333.1 4a-hydroxytetrahydrobiopterin dehydratase [Streptomyces flavofungini]GHC57951.1 putative pterin-4-alpha-carbinolamine dehydratase [Streptomyces flavofungini]
MPLEPLSQKEIEDRLAELPGWSLTSPRTEAADGSGAAGASGAAEVRLTRSYRLVAHFAATAFVVHIAQVQEELGHHADLTLGYNTVVFAVNTHSAGGALTDLDFELARRVEALASGHGAE